MSLLRSCYKTDCRFFQDNPDNVGKIEWYFTEPGAPWIGLDNVFNARTWYGNTDVEWPEIGEVQDAVREYRRGDNKRTGPPHGTAEQWQDGALEQDAVTSDPCAVPVQIGMAWPQSGYGYDPLDPSVPNIPLLFWNSELAYFQDPNDPTGFWTFRKNVNFHPCGYPAGCDIQLTTGPPDFPPGETVGVRNINNNCIDDVLEAQAQEIIGVVFVPAP